MASVPSYAAITSYKLAHEGIAQKGDERKAPDLTGPWRMRQRLACLWGRAPHCALGRHSRSHHQLQTLASLGSWTPHELRLFAASIMLAQGTPLYVVSEVLGHASVAITEDIYGRLVGGEK